MHEIPEWKRHRDYRYTQTHAHFQIHKLIRMERIRRKKSSKQARVPAPEKKYVSDNILPMAIYINCYSRYRTQNVEMIASASAHFIFHGYVLWTSFIGSHGLVDRLFVRCFSNQSALFNIQALLVFGFVIIDIITMQISERCCWVWKYRPYSTSADSNTTHTHILAFIFMHTWCKIHWDFIFSYINIGIFYPKHYTKEIVLFFCSCCVVATRTKQNPYTHTHSCVYAHGIKSSLVIVWVLLCSLPFLHHQRARLRIIVPNINLYTAFKIYTRYFDAIRVAWK